MSQRAKVLVNVDGTIVRCQTQGDVDVEVIYWDEFDHQRKSAQNLPEDFRSAFAETAEMFDNNHRQAKSARATSFGRTNFFWSWASRLRW